MLIQLLVCGTVCNHSIAASEAAPSDEGATSSLPHSWQEGEREEEGTLSDLDSDIDQYIASDKEVWHEE